MTALTAAGDQVVLCGEKGIRRESARVFVDMAIHTLLYRGNVIGRLVERADGNVIGVAIVAGFAIVVDIQVREVGGRGERVGYAVTDIAILAVRPTRSDWYWQMGCRFSVERVSCRLVVAIVALPAGICADAGVIEGRAGKENCGIGRDSCGIVMTVFAVLVDTQIRGKVIRQLAHADDVIVAIGAGTCKPQRRVGNQVNRIVRKHAGGEGSGGVANAAILGRRQMIGMLTRCFPGKARVAARSRTISGDTRMIEAECRCKTIGKVTAAAIGTVTLMREHRSWRNSGCLARRKPVEIGTAVVVVAGIAGLHQGIDTMVENPSQAKGHDAVAGLTVDSHYRVTWRFP